MGNRSFFNALHDREGDFLLATVLEGPAQGERVLLRNAAPVWPEELPAFWGEHLPALAAVTSSGILKSAGQRIFVERFGAAPQLVVCGGGHVGASVVRLAKLLGLPVPALEARPEFAEELRRAGADAGRCRTFAEGLAQIPGGQETYFVVVTRAHSCDIACLRSILQKPAAYVGMMGSRKRVALVHTQLAELGLPQERIDALHAPIGLSIGAKTAQEIALSILAEIVSVKNSRQQTEGFSPALLAALEQQTAPAVLATIVGRHGSTPQEEGSKMVVLPAGSAEGRVGGGVGAGPRGSGVGVADQFQTVARSLPVGVLEVGIGERAVIEGRSCKQKHFGLDGLADCRSHTSHVGYVALCGEVCRSLVELVDDPVNAVVEVVAAGEGALGSVEGKFLLEIGDRGVAAEDNEVVVSHEGFHLRAPLAIGCGVDHTALKDLTLVHLLEEEQALAYTVVVVTPVVGSVLRRKSVQEDTCGRTVGSPCMWVEDIVGRGVYFRKVVSVGEFAHAVDFRESVAAVEEAESVLIVLHSVIDIDLFRRNDVEVVARHGSSEKPHDSGAEKQSVEYISDFHDFRLL